MDEDKRSPSPYQFLIHQFINSSGITQHGDEKSVADELPSHPPRLVRSNGVYIHRGTSEEKINEFLDQFIHHQRSFHHQEIVETKVSEVPSGIAIHSHGQNGGQRPTLLTVRPNGVGSTATDIIHDVDIHPHNLQHESVIYSSDDEEEDGFVDSDGTMFANPPVSI